MYALLSSGWLSGSGQAICAGVWRDWTAIQEGLYESCIGQTVLQNSSMSGVWILCTTDNTQRKPCFEIMHVNTLQARGQPLALCVQHEPQCCCQQCRLQGAASCNSGLTTLQATAGSPPPAELQAPALQWSDPLQLVGLGPAGRQ